MLDFKGKGASLDLMQRIAAAGISFCWSDNLPVSSDDAATQAIIDAYTLDDAISSKCAEVARHAKALRDKVMADISPAEMSSWAIKASEAARFSASGDPTDAPMLSTEAAARGVSLAALVGKVGGKTAEFAVLESTIAGVDGRHRDAIKALTTFDAVFAYDYLAGWPAL